MPEYVLEAFESIFENISQELPFNPVWTEGYCGYWNGAIETDNFGGEAVPNLKVGEVAKTTDTHGRRAVFLGTHAGNMVLFERYKPSNGVPDGKINYQFPMDEFFIHMFGTAGGCNITHIHQFFDMSDPSINIATKLQRLGK